MTGRDRIVIMIVLVLAAVAGSWLLVISPKRDEASKLSGQVTAEQSQLDSARAQVAHGQGARSEFARDYTQLVRLGQAVPQDDNVPSLIYQLQGAAGAAHVDFRSLQVSSSGSSPSTPAGATSGSQASSAALPPGVTVGPAGFPVEQFSFTFRGDFFQLSNFFDRLQRFVVAGSTTISISGRLMTVNGLTLSPGPKGFPQITASVSATAYLVPPSQGVLAGATGAGPTAAAATVPGASSSPSTPTPAAAVTPVIR